MLFRQLQDSRSSTFTYLLADEETGEAVLIDPVYEQIQRDGALIDELGLKLKYSIETHVHADHVTAGWLIRDRFSAKLAISAKSAAEGADVYLKDGDTLEFGKHKLEARSTPGHTDGCMSFVLDDNSMAFTGDALLIRGAGRTDFQQGDAGMLYRSVHERLLSLPESCLLYPAHDYRGRMATSVKEEKSHNPRLGGDRSESDFVGFMTNLGLPHPKQIDVAVPANMKSGKPETMPAKPDWAPVRRTYAGIPELECNWLEENVNAVNIIDVREEDEFTGELGHIKGSKLVPLATLRDSVEGLSKDKPTVLVCRAGGRSAQGALILEKAGFEEVANLRGGMIRWRALGFPIA